MNQLRGRGTTAVIDCTGVAELARILYICAATNTNLEGVR